MANYSQEISKALDGILSSLVNIETRIKTTDDTVNETHTELINSIQNKLGTIMYKNTVTDEGDNTKYTGNSEIDNNYYSFPNVKPKLNPDNIKTYVPFSEQERDNRTSFSEPVTDNRTSFSEPDPNVTEKQNGGRRKRNRSSKNKRKSSEEQPEIKMEQEEAPESPKPQKKSFFSRFNPFKTKGGKRSRKHRTTKKGGRRHK